MKKIIIFLSLAFTLNAFSQVPNYVPTTGLVGWYPFSGNANDISGNGNNGTVYGAALTTDRFGNANKAYNYNGTSDYIDLNTSFTGGSNPKSFTVWFYLTNNQYYWIISGGANNDGQAFGLFFNNVGSIKLFFHGNGATYDYGFSDANLNQWNQVAITYNGSNVKAYLNGQYIGSKSEVLNVATTNISVGRRQGNANFFPGKIDDIGIWNRELTLQEITGLYNAGSCSDTTISQTIEHYVADTSFQNISPQTYLQSVDSLTTFGGCDSIINHYSKYIFAANYCTDTTFLTVTDTTFLTVTDTTFLTVTDTLIINAVITGLFPPNNVNTIKVYPNPAKTNILIDNGNYSTMNGYSIKITNGLGQTVFNQSINQQLFDIDLSSWSGSGLYFVYIIDPQNITIDIRKIVLQ